MSSTVIKGPGLRAGWQRVSRGALPVLVGMVFGALVTLVLEGCESQRSGPDPGRMLKQLKRGYVVLPEPHVLEVVSLVTSSGEDFHAEDLLGTWSLVFIGYTSCPDVCPTTLSTVGKMLRLKAVEHADLPLSAVFLSVDPARDVAPRLGQYAAYFHPDIVALTGERVSIDAFVNDLGASYQFAKEAEGDAYTVDHSTALFVVDPKATVVGTLLHPASPEQLLDDIVQVIAPERRPAQVPTRVPVVAADGN